LKDFQKILIIAVVGTLAYFSTLFLFFAGDDFVWLKASTNFSFSNLAKPFLEYDFIWLKFRFVQNFVFFSLYHLFGLSPFVFHFFSLILHLINTILFFKILGNLNIDPKVSFLSAIIFVSHFGHEETLFWVSANSTLLVAFFYLLGIWSFLAFVQKQKLKFYYLTILFFVLGLFSKEDAITLPFIVLFLTFTQKGRDWRKSLLTVFPFFFLLLLYLLFRFFVSSSLIHQNLRFDIFLILQNLCYFLLNFFIPVRSFLDFGIFSGNALKNLAGSIIFIVMVVLAIVLLSLVLFKSRRQTGKDFKLGLLFFLLTFCPYMLFTGRAQRLLYLPLLGVSLSMSALIFSFWEKIFKSKQSLVKKYSLIFVVFLLLLNFSIIQMRDAWWQKSSSEVRLIIAQAEIVLNKCPKEATINFTNVPRQLHKAFIFNMGFEEAMNLYYPSWKVREWGEGFLNNLGAVEKEYSFIWKGDKFIYLE
jgi:hypothetical protein